MFLLVLNRMTRNWFCRLPVEEKLKICVKVLEFVKEAQLTIEGLDTTHVENDDVLRSVVLASRPSEKLQVKMFRCPLKYSLDNSNFSVAIDKISSSFYVTRGTTESSIFVLHDYVAHEDRHSVNSNDASNLITEKDDLPQFDDMETDRSQHIQSVSEEQTNNASNAGKVVVSSVLDGNQDVYVTALFKMKTKKQNGISQYELLKVPDFSQMVAHMKKGASPPLK